MRQQQIFKLFFIFLALFVVFAPGTVHATTILSPLIEVAIAPGESQQVLVKVLNEGTETQYLKSSVEGFAADGERGEPRYIPADQAGQQVSWISLGETSIVVQPKQIVVIPVTISVPRTATPGGYYAVVFWQTSPNVSGTASTIGVAGKVGTLILISVTGDVTFSGEITAVATMPEQALLPTLPQAVSVRFLNTGSVHLRPTGTITIRKGEKIITTHVVNQNGTYVLPGSSRRFDVITSPHSANFFRRLLSTNFGTYQIEAKIQYEETEGAVTTSVTTIKVIPYYGMLALVILAIAGGVLYRIKRQIIRST